MGEGFETDATGIVPLSPVSGWTVAVIAETAVGLRIEFVRSEADLVAGRSAAEQLVLTAPQALELAEDLRRRAMIALQPPNAGTRAN